MKYLCLLFCLLLLHCVKAQKNFSGTLPYVHRDFLYYECANYFIIPPHPKAIVDDFDSSIVIVPAPVTNDSLPIIRLLKGQATLEIYEKANIFQIIPHSIEPITFICHTDTITFQVFYLTYDQAEISLHSTRKYKDYATMRLLPNLKNNYSVGNDIIVKEKYHSFQEIFFNADTLKTRMEKDTTLFMRFHLGLSKYKEALVRYRSPRLSVDSITVQLKDATGKLLRTNIVMPYHGYWIELNKLIDYQKDIKTGYSLEISCTTVFVDNYGSKKMKIYQDYNYCNRSISTYSFYNEINFPNKSPLVEDNSFMYPNHDITDDYWGYETDDGWANDPFGAEPCKDYGIPAVFRIKFY